MKAILLALLLSTPLAVAQDSPASAAAVTLRSMGAKGDGVTDDRAAVIKALETANGAPVDGEGATYAVSGNVTVRGQSIDLRNATFRQILPPVDVSKYMPSAHSKGTPKMTEPDAIIKMVNGLPFLKADVDAVYEEDPQLEGAELEKVNAMANLRTLEFIGEEYQSVSVKLEKIKVLRGDRADLGTRNSSTGISVIRADPALLTDVEITGNGKGAGLEIDSCSNVKLLRLNIHDILWAVYQGDTMPTLASLKKDWGWNNNPIYEYRAIPGRFVRYRIQEQLAGLFLENSDNIEIANSRIAHLGTTVDGKFLPWQVDGITIGRVTNLNIHDTTVSEVWEGIDLTGGMSDGFTYSRVQISDTFCVSFKIAHPKQNGKFTDCVSTRAGLAGFIMGPECENIEIKNCQSLDTGSNGYWDHPTGIRIIGQPGADLPRNITIDNCVIKNDGSRGTLACGIFGETLDNAPARNIKVLKTRISGAREGPIVGLKPLTH